MLPAKRGDLAIIRTVSRIAYQHLPTESTIRYELAVVTSITRDKTVKAVRMITGREAAAGNTKPTDVTKLPRFGMLILPAAELRVTDAIAAMLDRRANPETGALPTCTNPLDLLRDLHPWTTGSTSCLDELRSAAYRFLLESADQRCDDCGVTTYGDGRIDMSRTVPAVRCQPACPIGVNYTTNYPIGLDVEIIDGFAAGATAVIEGVSDHYPSDFPPDDKGTRYYSGRSYTVTLAYWGRRTFGEDVFRPSNPQLADRYTVRREAPATN